MPLQKRQVEVYECLSCGDLWSREDETCCGTPLESADVSATFDPPEVECVAREVFDISSTELVICRNLMTAEEATVNELARELSRDRSIIQRHVTHLHDLGVIEKRSRSLPDGGRVNVYRPRPVEGVRRQLQLGLYAWMIEAESRLEELNREKFEAVVEEAEEAAVDDAGSTASAREPAVENGGSEPPVHEADRSIVARLLDRWKSS